MDEAEQLATPHEALVELLRNLPRPMLIELICGVAGIELSELGRVGERSPTFEVPGTTGRPRRGIVDLVLVVHDPNEPAAGQANAQ